MEVIMEGRAAVAFEYALLPTATTERGPPDHWKTRSRSLENAIQITGKHAPDHWKTCAQNAHKVRLKGLMQPVDNNQPPCGIGLPSKPLVISCLLRVSNRLPREILRTTRWSFFPPRSGINAVGGQLQPSIRDNTLCNRKVHRPSREILANSFTVNQLQNHHQYPSSACLPRLSRVGMLV